MTGKKTGFKMLIQPEVFAIHQRPLQDKIPVHTDHREAIPEESLSNQVEQYNQNRIEMN
jgi:hypothetical protein